VLIDRSFLKRFPNSRQHDADTHLDTFHGMPKERCTDSLIASHANCQRDTVELLGLLIKAQGDGFVPTIKNVGEI
jgi:hypothetical protein